MIEDLKFDCIHFKGHIPCVPNKLRNKVCMDCNEYLPISKHILIIKLGAIGDVIRTTPLIVKYRQLYPECHITWITHSPEVVPADQVNTIYNFDFASVYTVKNKLYDIAVNLDKEPEACILLKDVKSKEKYGFIWKNNHLDVSTTNAGHKLITGLFDNISKNNTKNYLEEIFEICHLNFNDEPYMLNVDITLKTKWNSLNTLSKGNKIIGLNTGCGKRWTTRLWPNEYWLELIKELLKYGYFPVLLGGEAEDENNQKLSHLSAAYYPGFYSLKEFIALTSNCDIVVTQVSMMMHIVIALKIPLVLMNNIFNRHEFYLYNKGLIIEPASGCDCYYGNTCIRERSCMHDISPDMIFEAVKTMFK